MPRADRCRRLHAEDSGQATVEFALILPVIACAAWLVAAVTVVSVRQLEVMQTARVAARAAAVDPDPGAARTAAEAATRLRPLQVSTVVDGGLVTVSIRMPTPLPLPLPGVWRPDITVSARATMAREGIEVS